MSGLGASAYLILILGIVAVICAVLALVFSSKKRGIVFALIGFGFTALCCTGAAVFTMRARISADRAAETVDPREREAFTDAGYKKAAAYSKVAAPFGLLAFAGCVGAAARGLMQEKQRKEQAKREKQEKQPETVRMAHALPKASDLDNTSESMLGLFTFVIGALALFSVSVALVPLVMKTGGSRLDARDPANKIREAERLFTDGKFEEGCTALEQAFVERADPSHAKVKSLDSMIAQCVDLKLARAAEVPDEERKKLLAELDSTKMPLNEEQRDRIKAAAESRR